jgi:hypothetical protein
MRPATDQRPGAGSCHDSTRVPKTSESDEAERSRRQLRGGTADIVLLSFGNKSIIKRMALGRPIFGNEYC